MIKRATALGPSRPFPFRRVALLLGSALAVSVALAGCAGSGNKAERPAAGGTTPSGSGSAPSRPAQSGPAPSGPATGSSEAPCKQWSCTPGQPVQLGGGHSVRLWSTVAPTAALSPDRSTPVLELLHEGQHLQWWVGRAGFGWTTKLDCLPAAGKASAHCAVLAEVGSHAGTAEFVLLRSGTLVSPDQASVTFDGGRPLAADFDQDGWLDVLGTENDYQPNYASGRNYWATYRLADGSLQRTGCLPRRTTTEAPPERLLTGDCPVRFPS